MLHQPPHDLTGGVEPAQALLDLAPIEVLAVVLASPEVGW
jgi:hypothetical protein